MNKPDYLAPATLKEAFSALNQKKTRAMIIAGGTDLLVRMRAGFIQPDLLVDIRLLGLDKIDDQGEMVKIGTFATHTDILRSELLADFFPALVEAAEEIAGPPIRNRGTLGGNLVNASPAADLATPLLIYDGEVVLTSEKGDRAVPLVEFFTGPGQTVLNTGEILKEIILPKLPSQSGAEFIKLGKRKAMAIAVVSVAARLTLDQAGQISEARIALGSVAPVAMRAVKAEQHLIGKKPREDSFREAGEIARSECSPISDLRSTADYREKMVAVLTRRALTGALKKVEEKING
jgi:carbon-monoxide dehydrogenase medium subunit